MPSKLIDTAQSINASTKVFALALSKFSFKKFNFAMLDFDYWLQLFSKFHPLFVHLPIGFVFFAVVLELIDRKFIQYMEPRKYLVGFLFLSSVVSSIAGYLLSLSGGYEGQLLDYHMYTGFAFCALSFIWSIWIIFFTKNNFYKLLNRLLLIAHLVLISIVGHYGGSLTHGENYFEVEQASADGKPIVKVTFGDALVYRDVIQQVFNSKCISCHHSGKKKGDLRLDSFTQLMKGGESGQVVKAGDALHSELYKLITLDPVEKRAMPPKGKNPLNEQEIKIIEAWILEGANENQKLSELKELQKFDALLSFYIDGIVSNESKDTLPAINPLAPITIQKIIDKGLVLTPLNQTSNYIDVRLINNKTEWNDPDTKLLADAANHIVMLDLSGSKITKSSLEVIAKMKNLIMLQLQHTNLKDVDLSPIQTLNNLETINLYDTKVTDECLKNLKSKKLKNVYLWNTKVTEKGKEKWQKSNPNVQVVLDAYSNFNNPVVKK
ncbi:MAG: c-type cytochrome domain-containing protein [Bacteroidota bacterium]|nr:c-type cytochrome domain-containing protein [Bacteroidota bacterium]